jgi:hypothetical protein
MTRLQSAQADAGCRLRNGRHRIAMRRMSCEQLDGSRPSHTVHCCGGEALEVYDAPNDAAAHGSYGENTVISGRCSEAGHVQVAAKGGVSVAGATEFLSCETAGGDVGRQAVGEGPNAAAAVIACGHQQVAPGSGVEDPLQAAHDALVSRYVAVQLNLPSRSRRVPYAQRVTIRKSILKHARGSTHVDGASGGATRQQGWLLRVKSQAGAAGAEAEVDAQVGLAGVHDTARCVPREHVTNMVLDERAAAAAGGDGNNRAAAVP